MNGKIIHWNGTKWSNFPTPTGKHLYSVFMGNSSYGYAVGMDGMIINYNGTHWNNVSSSTTEDLLAVYMDRRWGEN